MTAEIHPKEMQCHESHTCNNLRLCMRSMKDMAYKTILRPKLLFGTHSLRTTSVDWKLYRGERLVLFATGIIARLGLFHHHKSVDIDATSLMTRSTRPTR